MTNLTIHQITATSLFSITVASGFGAYAYIKNDAANVPAAAALVSTSALASMIGAQVAGSLPGPILSRILGGFLIIAIPIVLTSSKNTEDVGE